MAQREMQYGDLTIAFTTDYNWLYQDSGSGGRFDGSFWRPVAPLGFKPVGDVVRQGYNNPSGNITSVVVRIGPAVQHPVDYQQVWNDRKSGGKYDGSCWRPVPPQGFVALGHVCNSGYNKPPLDAIVCVRKELCVEGTAPVMIWSDQGSGAALDVSTWRTSFDTRRYAGSADRIVIAPNTFVARGCHGPMPQPQDVGGIWVLSLPQKINHNPNSTLPKLKDAGISPEQDTKPQPVSTVIVPFTAVTDPHLPLRNKVNESAFYIVERQVAYHLLEFNANTSDRDTKVTLTTREGFSEQKSETMRKESGMKFSQELGFTLEGVFDSKTTLELTLTLGYERSSVSTWNRETERAVEIVMASRAATAVWIEQNIIQVRRADNTIVSTLTFAPSGSKIIKDQIPLST